MLTLLIPSALSLSGCEGFQVGIQGSGVSKTETRQVGSFNALSHNAVGEVSIEIGPTQNVEVTFDDNLLEIVDTSVVDGELRIKTSDSYSSTVGLKVRVTVPSIDHLNLSSVGSIKANGIDGDNLNIEQTGVGNLQVVGKVKNLNLKVTGVGKANLKELQAETATVKITGVGGATVYASESIDASTTGIGNIKVYGSPKEQKTKATGIGKISFE